MTQLEYNDENNSEFSADNAFSNTQYSRGGLVGFMMDKGIAKSEKGANIILIIIMIICLAAMAWMAVDMFGTDKVGYEGTSEYELEQQGIPNELREFYK